MNLYLVRHGAAKSKDEDPQRPLSDVGAAAVARLAAFLGRSEAIAVDEIWHSSKLRARQTAGVLANGVGLEAPLREVEDLEPLADVAGLARELSDTPLSLMLVGHLPHLDRLASFLTCGDPDREAFSFAPSAVLFLGRQPEVATNWKVFWMVEPALIPGD